MRELYDIWNYRAQLTPDTKRSICPPYGKPFGTEVVNALHNRTFEYLQGYSLSVINNLLTLGEDIEMRKLGGIYVLGALTMVNNQARGPPFHGCISLLQTIYKYDSFIL